MRYLWSLVSLAVALPLQAGDTLKDARLRLLRGNYAEAQEMYVALRQGRQAAGRGDHRPEQGPRRRRQLR